jgi:hypothetical protein
MAWAALIPPSVLVLKSVFLPPGLWEAVFAGKASGLLPEVLSVMAWAVLILPSVPVLRAVFLPPGLREAVVAGKASGPGTVSPAIFPPVASGVQPLAAKAGGVLIPLGA